MGETRKGVKTKWCCGGAMALQQPTAVRGPRRQPWLLLGEREAAVAVGRLLVAVSQLGCCRWGRRDAASCCCCEGATQPAAGCLWKGGTPTACCYSWRLPLLTAREEGVREREKRREEKRGDG